MERTCKSCGSIWDIAYIDEDPEFIIIAGEVTHCPNCIGNQEHINFYDTMGTINIPQSLEDFDPSSLID